MCSLLEGFPYFIVPTGKSLTETSVNFKYYYQKSVGSCNPFV